MCFITCIIMCYIKCSLVSIDRYDRYIDTIEQHYRLMNAIETYSCYMLPLALCCPLQARGGLPDGGVQHRHAGAGVQRGAPPLRPPAGPAALQLRRRAPVHAPHLPLPRLHEGPGGALPGLPITPPTTTPPSSRPRPPIPAHAAQWMTARGEGIPV